MNMTRRKFISSTAAAGAVLATAPYIKGQPVTRYTTALIGCGWWGNNILREAMAAGSADVVALCDVDSKLLDDTYATVEKASGAKPKRFRDYRDLFAELRPQVVIVATPDHWHPLITIEAVKHGAHVYVEKPIGHTIMEGRAMVNAARKYDRVVQVGTHRRVSPHNLSAQKFLKEGKLGKVGMVRAFVHYSGGAGNYVANTEPPSTLDWDLWCGPAPLNPFNPRMHTRGWRNYLDYANGTLGDWGIHWMDQILMWTEEKAPRRVFSSGGRHIKRDNTDAPDTQVATYEFESFTAVWEHRQYAGNRAEKTHENQPVGCYFYGTEGTLHIGWLDGWTFYPSNRNAQTIHVDAQLHEPDQQNIKELWADFMKSVASRQKPVCDIEIGHRSTNMALLGMLSYKLGRSVLWDAEKERIIGDEFANTLLRRDYRKPFEYPKV